MATHSEDTLLCAGSALVTRGRSSRISSSWSHHSCEAGTLILQMWKLKLREVV